MYIVTTCGSQRQLKHRPAFLMMVRRSLGDETVVHELGLCIPLQNTQVGSFLGLLRVPMRITSSFHMATNKGTHDRPKKDPTCVFCKGMHKPNSCTTVSSPKECIAIIKNAGLWFNCLGHHKLSQCTSKYACRKCHKKHHTSLHCNF